MKFLIFFALIFIAFLTPPASAILNGSDIQAMKKMASDVKNITPSDFTLLAVQMLLVSKNPFCAAALYLVGILLDRINSVPSNQPRPVCSRNSLRPVYEQCASIDHKLKTHANPLLDKVVQPCVSVVGNKIGTDFARLASSVLLMSIALYFLSLDFVALDQLSGVFGESALQKFVHSFKAIWDPLGQVELPTINSRSSPDDSANHSPPDDTANHDHHK